MENMQISILISVANHMVVFGIYNSLLHKPCHALFVLTHLLSSGTKIKLSDTKLGGCVGLPLQGE